MTTNQTIDGVPRRICHACVTLARNAYCPVCDGAPAAKHQGEPVADALSTGFYTTETGGGKYAINIGYRSMAEMQAADQQLRDLLRGRYAEQPAPVAVVLPSVAYIHTEHCDTQFNAGWNSCLDELKRLNPSL